MEYFYDREYRIVKRLLISQEVEDAYNKQQAKISHVYPSQDSNLCVSLMPKMPTCRQVCDASDPAATINISTATLNFRKAEHTEWPSLKYITEINQCPVIYIPTSSGVVQYRNPFLTQYGIVTNPDSYSDYETRHDYDPRSILINGEFPLHVTCLNHRNWCSVALPVFTVREVAEMYAHSIKTGYVSTTVDYREFSSLPDLRK